MKLPKRKHIDDILPRTVVPGTQFFHGIQAAWEPPLICSLLLLCKDFITLWCVSMPVNIENPIVSESPLLEGYQLLVEDIDYATVRACTDVSKLVKILRILRSSQLGFYPHLTEFTENRIKSFDPNHVMLKSESSNIWSKPEIMAHDDSDFIKDLSTFCGERSELDNDIAEHTVEDTINNLTPVRKSHESMFGDNSAKEERPDHTAVDLTTVGNNVNRRIKSWDFAGWDKYDPESEMEKAVEAQGGTSTRKTSKLSDTVDCDGLTKEEKERLAEREKEKGNEAYRAGDLDEAIVFYNRSISVIPSIIAINNRAQAYLKQEKYEEAASDCQYVLALDPQNIKSLLRLCSVCKKKGKYSQAKLHYEQVREISSRDGGSQLTQEMEKNIEEMDRLIVEEVRSPYDPYQLARPKCKGPIIEVIE